MAVAPHFIIKVKAIVPTMQPTNPPTNPEVHMH